MKNMKRVLAALLSVAMLLAMAVPAFADAATYTISTAKDDTHTYTVYQILTGDLKVEASGEGEQATSKSVLSNIKAGKNYSSSKGDAVAAAEAIKNLTSSGQALADAIAEYVDFDGEAYGTVSSTSSLTGVAAGYYLIKDNGAATGSTDAYSTYIVKVVNDVTITPKKAVPSFEKKVQDINGTTDSAAGSLQDSADYDIGDNVPFTLTATVASNYASYTHYYFEFQDSMENSLTFNKNSVVVTIDGKTVDSSKYEVKESTVTEGGLGGDSFSVIFTDLKTTDAVANSKVVVTYTAKLNENAALGKQGNVNEAKLVYSNNPNDKQSGKPETPGETPWDNVIVFTYKVVVNKYANSVADGNKLTGATFTLSKKLKDGTTKDIAVVKSDDGTQFTFKGLDDGDYVLTETVTPAGYNTINPITFTVKADHTITWDTGDRTSILTSLTGTAASGEITFTADNSYTQLSTDVINRSGSTLPETGGIGTTIFYVVGGCMMFGAAVLLITKKRMENQ